MPKLPRPAGHHSVTPSFAVKGAASVISFLERAFGARVVDRYDAPDGSVMHGEVMLGDSVVMLGEASPEMGPMPASLSYYVEDGAAVDAAYKRAIAEGATSVAEPADQFYGYRSAIVRDAGGNRWNICAVVEIVSPEESRRRLAEMMKGSG